MTGKFVCDMAVYLLNEMMLSQATVQARTSTPGSTQNCTRSEIVRACHFRLAVMRLHMIVNSRVRLLKMLFLYTAVLQSLQCRSI